MSAFLPSPPPTEVHTLTLQECLLYSKLPKSLNGCPTWVLKIQSFIFLRLTPFPTAVRIHLCLLYLVHWLYLSYSFGWIWALKWCLLYVTSVFSTLQLAGLGFYSWSGLFTSLPDSKCLLAYTEQLLLENEGKAQVGQILLYALLGNSMRSHKTILCSRFSNELEYSFQELFLCFIINSICK